MPSTARVRCTDILTARAACRAYAIPAGRWPFGPAFVLCCRGATSGPAWSVALKVVSILSIPVSIDAGTLLYFDLRVRSEGYGLDTLAAELEVGRSADPR